MGRASNSHTLPPGTTLGSYRFVRKLGSGAFGAVYEARKQPLDKRVAIKILHADHAGNETYKARFIQEAKAAASLKHPHIVDVEDVGELDGIPFLAMEFLDGEPLSSKLKREAPLSPAATLEALLPVLSAVAAMHEHGIVHRDLKPDNIFLWMPVSGQLHPKLLDFGIAKVNDPNAQALTASGAAMGTPRYMSPEQWGSSKHATGQSDQWALAVIAFECLTGRQPFEANEMPALVARVLQSPPMPPRAFVPTLSAELEAVVLRGLEKSADARHASVRAFGCALLPFALPETRARWSAEFGGVVTAPPVGLAATLPSTLSVPPPAPVHAPMAAPLPATLDAVMRPPQRAAPRRGVMVAAFVALALVSVLVGVAIAGRLGVAPQATAHPPPVATPSTPATVQAGMAASHAAPAATVQHNETGPTPGVTAPVQPVPAANTEDAGVRRRSRHHHSGSRSPII